MRVDWSEISDGVEERASVGSVPTGIGGVGFGNMGCAQVQKAREEVPSTQVCSHQAVHIVRCVREEVVMALRQMVVDADPEVLVSLLQAGQEGVA